MATGVSALGSTEGARQDRLRPNWKVHEAPVSQTDSRFFNEIHRLWVRPGRNHAEYRTREAAFCGRRTEMQTKKWVNS